MRNTSGSARSRGLHSNRLSHEMARGDDDECEGDPDEDKDGDRGGDYGDVKQPGVDKRLNCLAEGFQAGRGAGDVAGQVMDLEGREVRPVGDTVPPVANPAVYPYAYGQSPRSRGIAGMGNHGAEP